MHYLQRMVSLLSRRMKDSGIEWIGEIPEDWEITKLKRKVTCLDGRRRPVSSDSRESGEYPYWGAGSVTDYVIDYIFDEEIVLLGEDGAPFFDKTRDVAFYVNDKVWINNHIHVLKPSEDMDAKYLTHFLNIVDYGAYINGSILNKLTQSNMNNINIIAPIISHQRSITNFLDKKVSEIDHILEKTRESIEEYKKYKQSIITEAVTKGLNPDVKMRDSGIEWIGEIPEHWESTKTKYVFAIIKKIAGEEGFDILSATQSGLRIKDISSNEGQIAADYSKYQIVNKGDFVMNHMDLLTGGVDCSIYNGVTSPDYRVFRLIMENKHNPDYYKNVFQMCYSNKIFYGLGQGVSNLGRWRLQTEKFLNFVLPVPPLKEQKEIADYIDKKCSEINSLIFQKEALLNDLESYKKSLIYECVTGKREVV